MDCDDVGGDDILNNIKRDVMEMFNNALKLSLNQMCYCKAILSHSHWTRPVPDWQCKSCFAEQSRRVAFQCSNDECLFKRISRCCDSGCVYRICPSCFLQEGMDAKEDENQGAFVSSKVTQALNVIGILNSCFFNILLINISIYL